MRSWTIFGFFIAVLSIFLLGLNHNVINSAGQRAKSASFVQGVSTQAGTEELAAKVDVLMADNMTLKSEINQLVKNSEKLKLENAKMMEKLKCAKFEKAGRNGSDNADDNRNQTLSTENLLSRVNNSGSVVT
ncbi:hypothetical protein QQ045_012051 [Rhodiola kirilowii]